MYNSMFMRKTCKGRTQAKSFDVYVLAGLKVFVRNQIWQPDGSQT